MAEHDRRVIASALLLGLACAVGFVLLAIAVNGQGPIAFDERVATAIQGLSIPVPIWQLITDMGGPVLVGVDVLVVLLLVVRREFTLAVLFGGTLILVALGVDHVKDYVARPRPPDPLVDAYGYSFPSGHTFTSTVSYGLLVIIAWRGELPRRSKRLVATAAVVLVALIGCSRIALGVHYPTDVVAGWLGGSAVLCVVLALVTWWSARVARSASPAATP